MSNFVIPESIDVIPTAKCNLNCPMCWGPFHDIDDLITTDEWKRILKFFKEKGTKKVIFTGGEPLVRKDIVELVSYAKKLEYVVTLSTNTLLLKSKWEITNYIDQIGIPIDGSNRDINSLTRVGNPIQFDTALRALEVIKDQKLNIEVTIRTVVSQTNIDDLININSLLEKHKDQFDRWKIYQFAPVSYGKINSDSLLVNKEEFIKTFKEVKSVSTIPIIEKYLNDDRSSKYIFIGSDGDVYGVDNAGEYQKIGNTINESLNKIFKNISVIYSSKSKRK